jgi:TFIIF-interacting CTD phosphatase-like protein
MKVNKWIQKKTILYLLVSKYMKTESIVVHFQLKNHQIVMVITARDENNNYIAPINT